MSFIPNSRTHSEKSRQKKSPIRSNCQNAQRARVQKYRQDHIQPQYRGFSNENTTALSVRICGYQKLHACRHWTGYLQRHLLPRRVTSPYTVLN